MKHKRITILVALAVMVTMLAVCGTGEKPSSISQVLKNPKAGTQIQIF